MGSHIALISKNCAHWHMADLAIMMAGHVSIPIYPTLNASAIGQILEHSETKAIIVGKLDDFSKQKPGIPSIPIIEVGLYGSTGEQSWEELLEKESILEELHFPRPEDLYTIIYTSGTTGNPKGVMHTIGNFMTSVTDLTEIGDLPDNCRVFSYLPIAHVAERILENASFVYGATVTFPESLDTFARDLERTQPDTFFAVPRIFAKFQEKILEKLPQKKLSVLLRIPIVKNIIKSKLQEKLGLKEAKMVVSGAAPIPPSLIDWYETIGITILQIYGMTEDGCISHCNRHDANKVGTVGQALSPASVRLSPDGEICIKNNCLMLGYYKNPELTSEVFDHDGYFKTGDVGEYDHEGYLTITGRIKDQFKTDKGKYISPAPFEMLMSKNTDIEQICIVGTGIPQPIALVTLSELGRLKSREELEESVRATTKDVNRNAEKHEVIEKVVVMKEDWNVDNGLTTPTLKVKRNQIEKIHQPFYKDWFEQKEFLIFE